MKLIATTLALCLLLGGIVLWRLAGSLSWPGARALPAGGPSLTHDTPGGACPLASSSTPPPPASAAPAAPILEATPTLRTPEAGRAPTEWAADPSLLAAERAWRTASAALADDPLNRAALRDQLAALRTLERWDDAAATLARLIDLEPDDAELSFELAGVLLRQRRWVEAASLYQGVVVLQPGRAEAWFNLAVAHQAARRLSAAKVAWDRAIELRPDDLRARSLRAEVLLDLHEWTLAVMDLRFVLNAQPDDTDSALNLALALDSDGDRRGALAALDAALGNKPNDTRLLNRAAELNWSMHADGFDPSGRAGVAARDYWTRSLKSDPTQTAISQRLADWKH